MFDKREANMAPTTEDERIAVRCTRRELQHLDSFVVSGEFGSRSELIRAALRDYLARRVRGEPAPVPTAQPPALSPPEALAHLSPEELETYAAYGQMVANGASLGDILAQLARRGALELKVDAMVTEARTRKRNAVERRTQVEELKQTSEELQRRGILGP